jgi:hypothetical protein
MGLTAQQIVTRACRIARAPGFLADAGESLNSVLEELCETYDFDIARGTVNFSFNSQSGGSDFNDDFNSDFGPPLVGGLNSGPYALPSDYLRSRRDDVFYTIDGVKYVMISIDLAQYDALVQQPGLMSYPQNYTVDLSIMGDNNLPQPKMFVWPPPAGSYPVTVRYQRLMPDIVTPQTSAAIPWFPDTNYLITRVAGEMMKNTGDKRVDAFLGEGTIGAQGILNRYLKLANDDEDRAKTVTLDRRLFQNDFFRLKNTKTIGW